MTERQILTNHDSLGVPRYSASLEEVSLDSDTPHAQFPSTVGHFANAYDGDALNIKPRTRTDKVLLVLFGITSADLHGLGKILIACAVVSVLILIGLIIHIFFGPPQIEPHGAVASDVKDCSTIGVDMLRRGGSAVDAAIAAAFCLQVVNLQSSGIGGAKETARKNQQLVPYPATARREISVLNWWNPHGFLSNEDLRGGFMLVLDRRNNPDPWYVDFRETAPAAFTANMLEQQAQKPFLMIGVPGELRGFKAAHDKFGRLSWSSLIQPSIKLAREGFSVSKALASEIWRFDRIKDLKSSSALKGLLYPNGVALHAGQTITRPSFAQTLERIASNGAEYFYSEGFAKTLAEEVSSEGGILSVADITGYKANVTTPVITTYHGFRRFCDFWQANSQFSFGRHDGSRAYAHPEECEFAGTGKNGSAFMFLLKKWLRSFRPVYVENWNDTIVVGHVNVTAKTLLNATAPNDLQTEPVKMTVDNNFAQGFIWRGECFIGYKIITAPPPSSGPAFLMALNVLEGYNLTKADVKSPLFWQRFIETLKFEFANRNRLGDPAFEPSVDEIAKSLISKVTAKAIRDKMKADGVLADLDYTLGMNVSQPAPYGTSHISVVDSKDMFVSLTTTVNYYFGSGFMTSGGILLNDEMRDFADASMASYEQNNLPKPGKRPLSSMVPTIIYHTVRACTNRIAIGASNGTHIPAGVLNSLLNIVNFGMNVTDAIEYPRTFAGLPTDPVMVEKDLDSGIVSQLRTWGQNITVVDYGLSAVQAVIKHNKTVSAHSDSRKYGDAVDY